MIQVPAAILIVSLMPGSFTTSLSASPFREDVRQSPTPEASKRRDLVGLDAFPKLLSWLTNLPSVFDRFVEKEKRDQLGRELAGVAAAFGVVNNECFRLALMAETQGRDDPQVTASFDRLITSIVDLRGAVLALAKYLGDQAGKDGIALAGTLTNLTTARANVTGEARAQLLGGQPAEAAKRLRTASELANKAQLMVLEFVKVLNKE